MIRRFIKDLGRYKEGETRDYQTPTWNGIARSASQPLNEFSEAVVTDNVKQYKRGPGRPRKEAA